MKKKIAELRAKRAALRKQLRELADTEPSTAEGGMTLEELEQKVSVLEAEIKALDARITALEVAGEEEGEGSDDGVVVPAGSEPRGMPGGEPETRGARSRGGPNREGAEHRDAFLHYIRTGENRGLDTTTAGVIVPTYLADEIIKGLRDGNLMRRLATVRDIPGKTVIPAATGIGEFDYIAEGDPYPAANVTLAGETLHPRKLGGIVKVTEELVLMNGYDLESELRDIITLYLSEVEEDGHMTGAGVVGPKGVFTSVTQTVAAAAAALTTDNMIDLFYSLKRSYRNVASFLVADTTAAALRKLKGTDGHPLWQMGFADKPETFLGRPIYTTPFAPEIGAGKTSVLFGDFRYYRIGDRRELRIRRLDELYAGEGAVGFQVSLFSDGKLSMAESIKGIKHADE